MGDPRRAGPGTHRDGRLAGRGGLGTGASDRRLLRTGNRRGAAFHGTDHRAGRLRRRKPLLRVLLHGRREHGRGARDGARAALRRGQPSAHDVPRREHRERRRGGRHAGRLQRPAQRHLPGDQRERHPVRHEPERPGAGDPQHELGRGLGIARADDPRRLDSRNPDPVQVPPLPAPPAGPGGGVRSRLQAEHPRKDRGGLLALRPQRLHLVPAGRTRQAPGNRRNPARPPRGDPALRPRPGERRRGVDRRPGAQRRRTRPQVGRDSRPHRGLHLEHRLRPGGGGRPPDQLHPVLASFSRETADLPGGPAQLHLQRAA